MDNLISFTDEEKYLIAPILKDVTENRVEALKNYLYGYLADDSTVDTSEGDFMVRELTQGLYEKLCDFEDQSKLENILSDTDWNNCFETL